MRFTSFTSGLVACKIGLLSTTFLAAGAGASSAASLFENYLERGYSEVAVYARTKAQNTGASRHFSQKAADAAKGKVVTPDSPADTGRPVAYLAEQYDAHTRLTEALAAGAAEENARMAAVAQINYDCWLAELSAGPGQPDSSACRLLFYTALDQIAPEPNLDDFVTLAGAPSDEGSGEQATGGNDSPDRLPLALTARADGAPVTGSQQADGGAISAVSPLAPGEYMTAAALLYPVPMTATATSASSTSGAASENAGEAIDVEGAGTGATVAGALGGTVDRTSDSVGGAVSGVGGALGGAVSGTTSAAGGALSGAGGAVGGPVGDVADAAGDTVSGLGGAAGGAVSDVGNVAGGAISGLGGALGGAISGLGGNRQGAQTN